MPKTIYESTFTGAIDGIIIIDHLGIIKEINPAALKLFAYRKNELIGKNIAMLMAGKHHQKHDGYLKNYLETSNPKIIGTSRDLKGLKKDGSQFDFRLSVSEHKVYSKRYFTGFVHDISSRKKAERKLKEYMSNLEDMVAERTKTLEQNSRMLLTMAKNYPKFIISVIDKDLTYLFTEGKELEKMGFKSQELIGKNFLDKFTNKAVKAQVKIELNKAFSKAETRLEATIKKKMYEILAVPYQSEEDEDLTYNQRLLIVESDITLERKAKKQMEEMLEKEKKLNETKSRFVATASHEFKTPLTTIQSSTNLLKKYVENGQTDKLNKHFTKIIKNVEGLNQILKRFLSLEEINQGIHKPILVKVNIAQLFEELTEGFSNLMKLGQKFDFQIEANQILTDPGILNTILSNLVSNAIKYSSENTTISLLSTHVGKETHIIVKDEGMGMSKNEQDQVFEKFFRTEKVINLEGTGLGLSIVKNYMDLLKGRIELKSKPNKGSSFILKFPKI